jgi:hypothetical protein
MRISSTGAATPIFARQEPDHGGRQAHDHDREQEGHLPPHHVADAPEYDRTERPHGKSSGEREQRKDERRIRIAHAGEELLADDRRQRAVEIEVVPLEHGAERRRKNDAAHLGRGKLDHTRAAALNACS